MKVRLTISVLGLLLAPGRTLDEALGAATSINLKNNEAASHFRVALVHAINLCHERR
jgi:hypothetical protein